MQPTLVCCNRTLHAASVDSNFTHKAKFAVDDRPVTLMPPAPLSPRQPTQTPQCPCRCHNSQPNAARLLRIHVLALLGRSTDLDKNAYQGASASTQGHALLESQCMGESHLQLPCLQGPC